MAMRKLSGLCALAVLICVAALTASAQSFQVQCPSSTITHPNSAANNSEPLYNGPDEPFAGFQRVSDADGERKRGDQMPADRGR